MIANSATPYPQGVPESLTLNDLRVQNTIADPPSSTSALTLAGVALAVVLAIGAFAWLDPMHWFTPTEASPPTRAVVPSGEAAPRAESQQVIPQLTPEPATKSVEAPVAQAPLARAPQEVPAPAVQPRAASVKPEVRRNTTEKTTNTTLAQATRNQRTAPQALTQPAETQAPAALITAPEKSDAPIVPKVGDDTRNAPKSAAANETPAE